MNEISKIIYTVKALEAMAAVDSCKSQVQEAELQFAPLLYCIGNFFGIFVSLFIGLFISIFTVEHDLPFLAGICFSIFSFFSIYWWYEMWEARAAQIRYLDKIDIYELKGLSKAEQQKLALNIDSSSSYILWSYILYFFPHAVFLGYWYFMFGTFTPLP